MVDAAQNPGKGKTPALSENSAMARADLVNSGQDTKVTLRDGSTIVLKGVTRVDAVFGPDAPPSGS